MDETQNDIDTLEVAEEPNSSAGLLSAISKAENAMNQWQSFCDEIDDAYSLTEELHADNWGDQEYDLFWSSMEIMKPAIYARPPVPVISPQFKDRRALQNTTAELLERACVSNFDRVGIDDAMAQARDDLIFYNRGALWATYESDDGERVCIDHVDRKDFLHPPARKWCDVPWVARRAWMTRGELHKRFSKHSGDAYNDATLSTGEGQDKEHQGQAGVWELWHKAKKRVYWVSPGCRVILDEGEPHLKLSGFFPCPKPAYGTLRRRSLVPVPDYARYESHFRKINSLTNRIHGLLDLVRMKGLVPAGGEVGDAVEQALKEQDSTTLIIPVPGAMLTGGTANWVQWMPLAEIATAIQGLIEARRELFGDFDRLSGISDIMRGETEAQETLGAQQLKGQYGSVRVKEKVAELQRLARDVTRIAAEIKAENFSQKTLLEMSQMEVPTKADISKRVKEIEAEAKEEMEGLTQKAQQAAQQAQQGGQQIDPRQAKAQFEQAQQQIAAKYAPMLKQAGEQVSIEDVMKLLRDGKARGFAFEIATDSTVLTDEFQEKASRNEFLTVFTGATQGLTSLAAMGEEGAKLAGEVLKFTLQPYRVGRELNAVIDDFIDASPRMAAALAQKGQQDGQKELAEANAKIADAELQKAQAAIQKVEADTKLKGFELQQRQAQAEAQVRRDEQRFTLEIEQTKGNLAETDAKIEKIMAEIQKLGVDASNQTRKEDREDVKATSDIQMRQTDQAMNAHDRQRAVVESERNAAMANRQQEFSERQGMASESRAGRAEDRADRQQDFAERQPQGGRNG